LFGSQQSIAVRRGSSGFAPVAVSISVDAPAVPLSMCKPCGNCGGHAAGGTPLLTALLPSGESAAVEYCAPSEGALPSAVTIFGVSWYAELLVGKFKSRPSAALSTLPLATSQ
jgi:hypothetical protein